MFKPLCPVILSIRVYRERLEIVAATDFKEKQLLSMSKEFVKAPLCTAIARSRVNNPLVWRSEADVLYPALIARANSFEESSLNSNAEGRSEFKSLRPVQHGDEFSMDLFVR